MFTLLTSALPWVGLFLFFLALTKLVQTLFVLVTTARNKAAYETTTANARVIWVCLAYFLTSLVFFAS
jgi:hypothetical protein